MSLKETIVKQYESLTPELQKAAQFLIEHTSESAVVSMRAFAELAKVRPATLLRLAKALGFQGWNELKSAQIGDMGISDIGYSKKAYSITSSPGTELSSSQSIIKNIEAAEQTNERALHDAALMLQQANKIYICGFRASFSIAYYLHYILSLFKENISLIDGLACNFELSVRNFQANDRVILIGFNPISRELLKILDKAQESQCKIITITDNPLSAFARNSDVTLICSIQNPSFFFPSLTTGLSVVESLVATLLNLIGNDAIDNLKKAEKYFLQSNTYLFDSNN